MPSTAKLFVQTALARAYPRAAWMFRNRTWLIQETVLPVLSVSAFALSYRAMGAPPEYVGFVILGAAMTTFWLNVLWAMGAHLYWERDSGNLGLYIMAPAPMMGVLAGMALGGMTTTCVRAAAIVTAGLLIFNVPLEPTSWWLFAAIFLITLVALYGLGMMFASLFLAAGREAWHLTNLLVEPIYLASGLYFPVKSLGFWVATFASVIPLTLGLDAMRQLLFSDGETIGFLPVSVEILGLVVLSVLFIGAAWFLLSRLEEIGRRDGRLIEKKR